MRKSEIVNQIMEIIKRMYAAEKKNILATECSHSDTLQALADECHGMFNGFLMLLDADDRPINDMPQKSTADIRTEQVRDIVQLYENNIAPITSIVLHSISDWLNDMDADVIKWAITEAVKLNKRSWKYIEGILRNHHNAGRTTMAAVQDAQRTYKARQNAAESVYDDKDTDYAELEKLMQERIEL